MLTIERRRSGRTIRTVWTPASSGRRASASAASSTPASGEALPENARPPSLRPPPDTPRRGAICTPWSQAADAAARGIGAPSDPSVTVVELILPFHDWSTAARSLAVGSLPIPDVRSGAQHQTVRLPFASAQRLDDAGKVMPILRSMCLTMPAYVLNNGIFNHPSPLRVLRASRCVDTQNPNDSTTPAIADFLAALLMWRKFQVRR